MRTTLLENLTKCSWSQKGPVATIEDIVRLEGKLGVTLPADYRAFITATGPGYLDGWAPCNFPTPFGEHGITHLYCISEIEALLDSKIVPRNMICIGAGDFGAFTCLALCGLDRGAVYSLDSEMNFYKDLDGPQQFYKGSTLAETFYRLRDNDELPPRPWGYENCYHVADSFDAYICALHPLADE